MYGEVSMFKGYIWAVGTSKTWDLGSRSTPPSQPWDTMAYGRQAGGTHTTGMLSCHNYVITTKTV